jgi:hypothetical protein
MRFGLGRQDSEGSVVYRKFYLSRSHLVLQKKRGAKQPAIAQRLRAARKRCEVQSNNTLCIKQGITKE